MPRRNGSYFGFTAAPTPSVASGIWRVSEAEQYLRENKWPATPGVPGSPTGTPGDGQVSLTWSAPTLGSPPTDYEVQYSSNAGSTWTTFTDGVGTTTSATVTGLTNGTGYIFRVRALNALGEGPYGSASGTITPVGIVPTLLLHFDGTNGSTTFTDSSPSNLTVTAYGNAEISTAESKFGGASGYFDGNASYASVPDGSAVQFGGGDFTLEFWCYPFDSSALNGAYCKRAGGGTAQFAVFVYLGSTYIVATSSGSSWDIQNAGGNASVPSNAWSHIAFVRYGNEWTVYVNGAVSQQWTSSSSLYDGGSPASIGSGQDVGQHFDGYIDEFRIVKGTAVYTAPFTPPSAAF